MREKFICAHFATSWHYKIGSKARFFASSPPYRFLPKTAFFRPIRPLWGQNPPFAEHFLLLRTGFSRPKSHFTPKKSVRRGVFRPKHPKFDFCRRGKRESRRFSLPPPLHSKNTSRLSLQTSPLFATSSLVLSQTSLPRTNSHSILRAGHAPTRIYALAHSPNLPFLPSPFTSPHNKLYISRLSVKASPAFTFTFTATI